MLPLGPHLTYASRGFREGNSLASDVVLYLGGTQALKLLCPLHCFSRC